MNTKNDKKVQKNKNQCDLPLNDEELKMILTPEQYRITRKNGTELPFKNAYWDNKRSGLYVDVISGEPLFISLDKFDSGTGWPSFTKPLVEESIIEKADISQSVIRTEVRAKKSDAHLGHVFNDGPGPRGLRYCINSAALRFVPVEDLEKEGYGKYLKLFPNANISQKIERAIFGAGCFWGIQAYFQQLPGVISTQVGFMGGKTKNPTYEDVCTDKTGYAEVVMVEFDAKKISYEKLLAEFWKIHDPTTLNRQGPDVGTQYRSIIFYNTPEQEKLAKSSKEILGKTGKLKQPIVTEIRPAGEFYPAEEYHQDYFKKRDIKPTCHLPLK